MKKTFSIFVSVLALFVVVVPVVFAYDNDPRQPAERIMQGYPETFAEMDRLLSDKNSPRTFVLANDIDGNDANGDDGVVFTTIMPEDIIDFPPDARYQAVKKAGRWELLKIDGDYEQTYMEIMAEVIDGLSGILVFHINERCYVNYWQ